MDLTMSILAVLGLSSVFIIPIWFAGNGNKEGLTENHWLSLAETFNLTPNESLLAKKRSFIKGFTPELKGLIDGYLVVIKYVHELFTCKIELKKESNYSFDIAKKNEILMTRKLVKTGDFLFDNSFSVRDFALNLNTELLDEKIINTIIRRFSTNMLGVISLKQKKEKTEGLLDLSDKSFLEFSESTFTLKNAQERKMFENRLIFLIEFAKRIDSFET
jgi:hypothetical protein